eukprot:CAMPEP_0170484580 /NCGR_PEP_ID=MMETSP0208-20121228/3998_1 /TAXON_ID=197538 /ORGANISM="Strombidium inclinatum, Strain S3" /LENGTH=62 /DNA_ID=CAMNT_0010757927 /DNA_START=845 /DNA_END=1033 /DNA_ORIENTATION=+
MGSTSDSGKSQGKKHFEVYGLDGYFASIDDDSLQRRFTSKVVEAMMKLPDLEPGETISKLIW